MNKITFLLLSVFVLFVNGENDEESTIVEYEYSPIFTLIEEKCTNSTGDPSHFRKVMAKIQEITDCLSETINITAINIELEELEPLGRVHEVVNKTCRQQDKARLCVEGENLLDVCLTAEEQRQREINLNLFKSLMTYFCQNDGELITGLITEPGYECIVENNEELTICITPIYNKYIVETHTSQLIASATCEDVNELHICALPLLRQCKTQMIADTLVGFINILNDKMSCVRNE